jgi:hypothetical protein
LKKDLVIVINWYGPYTRAQAMKVRDDYEIGGLYMAIGKPKGSGRHKDRPQYVGISEKQLVSRCTSTAHHTMKKIHYDNGLWLGEVSTAEPSGKRIKATKTTLDSAEWLHACFMNLKYNKKKRGMPKRPAMVINRWWHRDYEKPWIHRPDPAWPDLIDFQGPDLRARVVWFGGRQKTYQPEQWKKKAP